MEKGKVKAFLTFFLFLLLFSAVYAQDYGDAIVLGSIGEPKRLIPLLASDSASATISGFVFNGLLKYDGDLNLVGDLAESWEIEDGGRVIVFHLRKGVLWQDGKPFTARDVKFTYEKLVDPKVATPYSGDFELIKKFEVIDDYTVRITYKYPFAPALSSWTMGIIPEHLLKNEDLNTTGFNRHPVGTGPFILESWKTGQKLVLRANPRYFRGRPYLDRVIYRIIPDSATMFLELASGNLDYMGLTPFQYKRQTNTEFFRKNFRKFRYPALVYTYLGYNLRLPIFSDKRVRKALTYAIDRKLIVDVVLLGLGQVSNGIFPPSSWACDTSFSPLPYDPKKAKELLAEAGWRDTDGDGVLDKDGKPFEFTIVTNQGNSQRINTAEIIQYELAQVGVKVKIRVLEWQALLRAIYDRNFQAIILGWSLGADPDPYDIWHSSKTKPGEFNFVGYKNPEVDRLIEEARRIFDRKKRAELYHKIQRLIYEDYPYTFLYVPDNLSILHRRFRNVKLKKAGIWYNFEKWYVPKKLQKYRFTGDSDAGDGH
ncbi:MAG: peptide-binding protein [Deferribacteres bacterium]|nr:peptide-binding protein [Deferribacteres bacterium]